MLYKEYEKRKKQLKKLDLTPEEYETEIKKIVEELEGGTSGKN